jgi:NHL repeat
MASRNHIVLESDISGRSHPGVGYGPGAGWRPWSWLLAGVVLVVVLDLLLALVQPSGSPEPALADDLPRARAALQRAVAHADGWLLVGDSVLAGDVMQGETTRWSEHRVLDYMRREQAPHEHVGFEQIALDGLLPVDMLRIIRELDVLDPGGRVGVVLELNPRFFSAHYAEQATCSREFLCELGETPAKPPRWAWIVVLGHQSWQWLGEHLPLWRHRERFPHMGEHEREALLPRSAEPEVAAADPLIGRARILEHYRKLQADGRSAQYQALKNLVERLRTRGRRALLFATPLNDAFLAGTLTGQGYGRYVAALDRLVNRPGDTTLRFASLDHPSLPDGAFIDHVHLRPEGNRWLAQNLLHQLGVGLSEAPPRNALVYEEGPDRSLLARVDRGNREGAPWQAGLEKPHGIEVAPGGGRVVVADTGNHCVRELVGPLTTLRTLAGKCGKAGDADGKPRRGAAFRSPRLPVLVREQVYVVDGELRERLRELADDHVRTILPVGKVRWRRIDAMRSDGHDLWLIDEGTRVLRVDPRSGRASVRLWDPEAALVALDVGPDGRIYLADVDGRLWQLSPGDAEPVLLFANEAEELMPQQEGDFFPFGFDELALDHVVDLRYVDRYDALLVQDEHQVDERIAGATERAEKVTERVHLRLVSPRERKVYPWVHPLVHGGGHVFHNRHTGALSSYLHRGSMALEPGSATLFYVERERTRLLALSDGLYGTAKLGHHVTPTAYGGFKDVFGLEAGQSTMLAHHPERWAHRRLEPLPRRGPYLGLLLGSSMTSVTEVVGQYSLGRVIERELGQALGVRDGIRFDMAQRSFRGPRLERLVATFESFVEHQAPVDVVFFEVRSGRTISKYEHKSAMVGEVDRIRRAAARYDTRVVILDNDAMTSSKRDGLRGSSKRLRELLELCRDAGFVVLRPSDLLLREAIDHAPWGNAPFKGTHGSTWAMDLSGETFAALAYPAVREHLWGRVPALQRPRVEAVEVKDPVYAAFTDAAGDDWAARVEELPPEAMQRNLEGSRLELLVDLGKAGVEAELSAAEADMVVLGYLVEALVRDPMGKMASEVTISLARFGNYDEYGVGVLEGAEVVERREYDRAGLAGFLGKMSKG